MIAELARARARDLAAGAWSRSSGCASSRSRSSCGSCSALATPARWPRLRAAIDDTLDTVRSLPWVLAMAVVRKDLGPRSPWGRFRVAVERFDAMLFDLLARAAPTPSQPGEPDDSMLSVLLAQRDEHGNPPSDQHLRDELVALLVGGHDSSAAALAWAFERLAHHPAAQARLRDGDPAYLDAVVKEVPAHATAADHRAAAAARARGDRAAATIPAGVQVAACLWLACRREDLWPAAASSSARSAGSTAPTELGGALNQNPLSWIPFGGGVRRCAGAPFAEMEMREVIRAAAELPRTLRPARPEPEHARRSMLVLVPHRGGELLLA